METFDKRAVAVKGTVSAAYEGKEAGVAPKSNAAVAEGRLSRQIVRANVLMDIKAAVKQVDALRAGSTTERGLDISFEAFVKEKWGFGSLDSFYDAIGVDLSYQSMASFNAMPEFNEEYKWLVPEIVRAAVRLGIDRPTIYNRLISAEETVTQPTVVLPLIKRANVPVADLGEAESIPTGIIDFDQKSVTVHRIGTGIKVTDQVNQYTPLNIVALYLQEVGVQLGWKFDGLAIKALINGDQEDGSDAIASIGVDDTAVGFSYRDLLRAWLRMGRNGRTPSYLLSGEEAALDILELKEFKGFAGAAKVNTTLNLDTVIPNVQNYLVTGLLPSEDWLMLVDARNALIKLNVGSLRVEADRIVEKGINATYVTQTTGFTTMFREARLLIDKTKSWGAPDNAKFPAWFDTNEKAVQVI